VRWGENGSSRQAQLVLQYGVIQRLPVLGPRNISYCFEWVCHRGSAPGHRNVVRLY
jgi:hypothetical protein